MVGLDAEGEEPEFRLGGFAGCLRLFRSLATLDELVVVVAV